jgi:hypothetical protein
LEAILAAKHRLEDEAHRKNLDKPEDNAQAAVDEKTQIVTGVTLYGTRKPRILSRSQKARHLQRR